MMKRRVLFLAVALFTLSAWCASAQQANLTGLLVKGKAAAGANVNVPGSVVNILNHTFKGRFNSYELVGRAQGAAASGKSASLNLGAGHNLNAAVQGIAGNKLSTKLRWNKGGKNYLNADAKLNVGGNPMVVGGPKDGDGTLLLLIQAKP